MADSASVTPSVTSDVRKRLAVSEPLDDTVVEILQTTLAILRDKVSALTVDSERELGARLGAQVARRHARCELYLLRHADDPDQALQPFLQQLLTLRDEFSALTAAITRQCIGVRSLGSYASLPNTVSPGDSPVSAASGASGAPSSASTAASSTLSTDSVSDAPCVGVSSVYDASSAATADSSSSTPARVVSSIQIPPCVDSVSVKQPAALRIMPFPTSPATIVSLEVVVQQLDSADYMSSEFVVQQRGDAIEESPLNVRPPTIPASTERRSVLKQHQRAPAIVAAGMLFKTSISVCSALSAREGAAAEIAAHGRGPDAL